LLTCAGLDGKVKIWDALGSYKCMRTYLGHSKGVKDINFTNDGAKFVSVGYDKNIRLWDTETGQVSALLRAL
jgi:pre-mRNA-processing factor 17